MALCSLFFFVSLFFLPKPITISLFPLADWSLGLAVLTPLLTAARPIGSPCSPGPALQMQPESSRWILRVGWAMFREAQDSSLWFGCNSSSAATQAHSSGLSGVEKTSPELSRLMSSVFAAGSLVSYYQKSLKAK